MKFFRAIILVALTVNLSGCTANKYLVDRKRDALDIFTLTLGKGNGGNARIGPIQLGLLHTEDQIGLRGGVHEFGKARQLNPLIPLPGPDGIWAGEDIFEGSTKVYKYETEAEFAALIDNGKKPFLTVTDARGKSYRAKSQIPFVIVPELYDDDSAIQTLPYFTQIEVTGGIIFTARIGFNLLELIDFIIGWTSLDIVKDDI